MGVKERRGLLGGVVSSREQERQGKICCCVGSALSVFLLDPRVLYRCRSLKSVRCILSVDRQYTSIPTNCDFLSAVTTSRVTTTTILVFSRSFTFL